MVVLAHHEVTLILPVLFGGSIAAAIAWVRWRWRNRSHPD